MKSEFTSERPHSEASTSDVWYMRGDRQWPSPLCNRKWSSLIPRRKQRPGRSSAQIRLSTFRRTRGDDVTLDAVAQRVHDDPGSLLAQSIIREAVDSELQALHRANP